MIPEPQRSYVLELLDGLGAAAESFVLAGAQAMKFMLPKARATRDFDFVLDVLALRQLDVSIREVLGSLGYTAVPEARNFQFQKAIPGSNEVMRIEFMGPEEERRKGDFRVEVQEGVHARACTGGTIALAESDWQPISGLLPSGRAATVRIRVIRPAALVLMECLAMDDRYRAPRGEQHSEHDRNEARIHVGDIVAVVSAQARLDEFRTRFSEQSKAFPAVRARVLEIIRDYFDGEIKPGWLLYEELLTGQWGPEERAHIRSELRRDQRVLAAAIPK